MGMKTLLVMAAGMGSRYGGLKQMEAMGPHGETMLDYSVFDALQVGFRRVVFVIRAEFAQAFQDQIGSRYKGGIEVGYAFQDLHDLPEGFAVPAGRVKPWGTLHAVWAARKAVNGAFAAVNADDFYGRDAYLQVARFLDSHNQPPGPGKPHHYCMVGYRIEKTLSGYGGVNRGICSEHEGLLKTVQEFKNIAVDADGVCRGDDPTGLRQRVSPAAVSSMNIWGFSPAIFGQMGEHFARFLRRNGASQTAESYIPDVVDDLIRSGQADCRILPTESDWFGVTYPQDKPSCVQSIAGLVSIGAYPRNLHAPLSFQPHL